MAHLICMAITLRFVVILLLVLGTDRLSCTGMNILRSFAAAAVESMCRTIAMFVLPHQYRHLSLLISFVILGGLAFGRNWRKWGIYGLLLGAVSSIAQSLLYGKIVPVLLAAIGVWAISSFSGPCSQLIPIEIQGFGKCIRLTALRDTGNMLKDPISGEPVMVISAAAAYKLTGLSDRDLSDPLGTMANAAIAGLRLVPYCAIGQKSGLLLALRYPNVKIGNRKSSHLIAFAPEGLEGQDYQALLGGMT